MNLKYNAKEQLLHELQPFSHGAWAHTNINRIALFGRNLAEATSTRQYGRFRLALEEYLEKIYPALKRIAHHFQIIRFDPNAIDALRFHAGELAKAAQELSANPVLPMEEMQRHEAEIPKHVDQLLHVFHLMREEILSEFHCRPNQVLRRVISEREAEAGRGGTLFALRPADDDPIAAISEQDFAEIVGRLIDGTAAKPNGAAQREVSFLARTALDRWTLEIRDTGLYLPAEQWRDLLSRSDSGGGETVFSGIPEILAKYDGDFSVKESKEGVGTTFLLRLRTLRR